MPSKKAKEAKKLKNKTAQSSSTSSVRSSSSSSSKLRKNMKTEGDKFTANQNKQKNEIKDSKLIGQTKKEQPVP